MIPHEFFVEGERLGIGERRSIRHRLAVKDVFDRHFRFRLRDARLAHNFVDDIEFDQMSLPGDRRSTFPA